MTSPSMMQRRYLALWFPYLSTNRLHRTSSPCNEQAKAPLVLVEKVKGARRLSAVDRKAASLGLQPGLTLTDARARVPDLDVADIDREEDQKLLEAIADACDRWTPLVAPDPPDGLILDITGCAHLFGGETAMGLDVTRRMRRAGLDIRLAMAATSEAAAALARFGNPLAGKSAPQSETLRALPVAALRLPIETVTALKRAGLKTLGDLADRPSLPLSARFSVALVDRLRRTLELEDIRITPRRPPPAYENERPFAEPIGYMTDIESALAGLIEAMTLTLQERGEGGRAFEAAFFRTDGVVRRISVQTGRPSRTPQTLIRLFCERLEALSDPLDPGFGFDLIRFSVPIAEPFETAQTSLEGHETQTGDVAELIDRLSTRYGAGSVLRFQENDSHDPLRAVRRVRAAGTLGEPMAWTPPEKGAPPTRPLCLFDPPQPIETLAAVPDGPPIRFRWRRVLHDVTRAEGPERIAPEWWRKAASELTRDYYRVEDRDGRRFWVFRAGLYERETDEPRWFMHGIFA